MGEFELIERYFLPLGLPIGHPVGKPAGGMAEGGVALGIGDDAALLEVPPGRQLVAALDTLVEGRHFLPGTDPASIGHRALAVNLSDLAAMGADPAWFLLALTLPRSDTVFLEGFARGLHALASRHSVALVGGDTTAGPLVVSVQALGMIEPGLALRRDGAAPGDLLYVSGTTGDAAAGLKLLQSPDLVKGPDAEFLRQRFLFPEPRVELGRALRGIASACIDVSDGLAGDAARLAAASGCGASIEAGRLPLSAALVNMQPVEQAQSCALTGGDDYELCFTVAPARAAEMESRLTNVKCRVTCIGRVEEKLSLRVTRNGKPVDCDTRGYDHFPGAG